MTHETRMNRNTIDALRLLIGMEPIYETETPEGFGSFDPVDVSCLLGKAAQEPTMVEELIAEIDGA